MSGAAMDQAALGGVDAARGLPARSGGARGKRRGVRASDGQICSKLRRRSQSVTARLKVFHSWRAVFSRWWCTAGPNASLATVDYSNSAIASGSVDGTWGRCGRVVGVAHERLGRLDAVLDAVEPGRDVAA